MNTWYMARRQGGGANKNIVLCSNLECRHISEVAWAVVVRKTSQARMADATPRVGTWDWRKAQEELLDNDSARGERGTARPEERSLEKPHLHLQLALRDAGGRQTISKEQARTGHIAATWNGEGIDRMAGLLGCCWWLQARARDCGQGRARTAARCISQQTSDGYSRVMLWNLGVVWCGLARACVLVCVRGCARGGDGGERNEVAGTTWRSESLESGVWSFSVEESGWFEARGDENVPAVPIQTHRLTLPACQPPQPQSYQSCIAKCSSCHGERNMADIYAN